MIDASYPDLRAEREQVVRDALAAMFEDQRFDVLTARRVLGKDWDRRLADLMFKMNLATATLVGDRVAEHLPGDFTPAFMHNWLRINADAGATSINDSTRAALDEASDDEGRSHAFDLLAGAAGGYARTMVTRSANFGAHDAATFAGGRTKTWTGGTTRHSRMNGQTVPLSQNFSNGMRWPGDSGDASEVANCGCSVIFK